MARLKRELAQVVHDELESLERHISEILQGVDFDGLPFTSDLYIAKQLEAV